MQQDAGIQTQANRKAGLPFTMSENPPYFLQTASPACLFLAIDTENSSLGFARTAETAFPALAGGKFVHDFKFGLYDGYDNHLGDAFERFDGKRCVAPVPNRNFELALIVGIDEAEQIAQNDTVFVSQPGARQYHGGVARVGQMNRQTGRDEECFARLDGGGRVYTGAQVEPGRAGRGIRGQLFGHFRIKDFDFYRKVHMDIRIGLYKLGIIRPDIFFNKYWQNLTKMVTI